MTSQVYESVSVVVHTVTLYHFKTGLNRIVSDVCPLTRVLMSVKQP